MQLELNIEQRLSGLPYVKKRDVFLIEHDNNCSKMRSVPGATDVSSHKIDIHIHRVSEKGLEVVSKSQLEPAKCKSGQLRSSITNLSIDLLREISPSTETSLIVAGTDYGSDTRFISELRHDGFDFVVELRPSFRINICCPVKKSRSFNRNTNILSLSEAINSLSEEDWSNCWIIEPTSRKPISYSIAELGVGIYEKDYRDRLFVAQRGSIRTVNRGTVCALTSLDGVSLESLTNVIGWNRWVRPITRRKKKASVGANRNSGVQKKNQLVTRPNLKTGSQRLENYLTHDGEKRNLKHVLTNRWSTLNIAELFSGAGGMGLGFLMANSGDNPYRIIFSGEVNPIYVQTLSQNHKTISDIYSKEYGRDLPEHSVPIDLRDSSGYSAIEEAIRRKGEVHVLIGGPPCQGFSTSNRNSGGKKNPNNLLFNVFLDYVESIRPAIFLLENVQGVAWAKNQRKNGGDLLVYLNRRMRKSGYIVSQKLLDASWYGVPQYRYRFFAIGIREDLGYELEDFGSWGPYPRPTHGTGCSKEYVTVRDAIGDLPAIGNGYTEIQTPYEEHNSDCQNEFLKLMRYGAQSPTISDHVTSRHADYVLERYAAIPEGGNWEDIKDMMSNYANISRTHSNIYRRLTWDKPSVTIGHYRKSMLIHPQQTRGLSLREAARLQSFPDWVRFAGNAEDEHWTRGLVHKQQQLANAVCPLMTKAVAEFILNL